MGVREVKGLKEVRDFHWQARDERFSQVYGRLQYFTLFFMGDFSPSVLYGKATVFHLLMGNQILSLLLGDQSFSLVIGGQSLSCIYGRLDSFTGL